jgi:hypothetical protein
MRQLCICNEAPLPSLVVFFKQEDFLDLFYFIFYLCTFFITASSTPLKYHCVAGCWDPAQYFCDSNIESQML